MLSTVFISSVVFISFNNKRLFNIVSNKFERFNFLIKFIFSSPKTIINLLKSNSIFSTNLSIYSFNSFCSIIFLKQWNNNFITEEKYLIYCFLLNKLIGSLFFSLLLILVNSFIILSKLSLMKLYTKALS